FFLWLVVMQADGAEEIVLDFSNPKTSKFPREDVLERGRNIIAPGVALAGLPMRYGTDASDFCAFGASPLWDWIRSGRDFKRLRTVKPAVQCDFTVTIRRNRYAKMRNSNFDAWHKFAERIGAIVIEDFYDQPIPLHDRVALYAGAKMNFGV